MSVVHEFFDSIAITGNRDYADPAALYRGIDRIGARQYYFGGARGVDTDALKYIHQTQPEAIRTVVVPNTLADQPVAARAAIKQHATNIIELKNSGTNRYQLRNKYMVDRADKTVGFYDYRGRGGTHQTINYAESKGKLHQVNPLVKFDEREIMSRTPVEQRKWIENMRRLKTELRAIKGIILRLISERLAMTVSDYFNAMGYPGCKTLEQYWSL